MHKPIESWTNTFRKLGLRRRKSNGRKPRKHRSLQMERLQPREMLATDVAVTSFSSDDTDWVVQYDVANEDAAAFDIGVYRSSDGVTPDVLLVTYAVSNAADRTVGVGHSLTISADFVDVEQDYFLIAQVDSGGVLVETDETNNQALFAGGLFLESDGTLQFHGDSAADTLGVLWDQVAPDTLEVSWNTVRRNYAVSAVSTIHVRMHAGADTLTVDPDANLTIWAFGGDGADYLEGGSYDDKLYGGGGNDSLFGGDPSFGYGGSGGVDYLWGGAGDDGLYGEDQDDHLYGEAGDDTLDGGAGVDWFYGGAGFDSPEMVDNADAEYSETGSWYDYSAYGGAPFHGGQRLHYSGSGSDAATWTFTGLASSNYDVHVTWLEDAYGGASSAAPFTIFDNTTNLGTVSRDQSYPPTGATVADRPWDLLGTYAITSGTLVVTLNDDPSGTVLADAVRIVPSAGGNSPPVAVDDSGTTDGIADVVGNVLANDSDPDSDPLTASLVTSPMYGSLTLNSDGSFTYSPYGGFTGDSFTYQVSDGQGGTAQATVTLSLSAANTAPVTSAGADASISEGDTFSQSGSFTDPDADVWTATVDYGDGTGSQTLTLNGDKTFSLSHVYADDGVYNALVTVDDGAGGQHADTVIVSAGNVAPTLGASGDSTVAEDTTYTLNLSSSDPGADTISSWEITWGDGAVETVPGNPSTVTHVYAAPNPYTITATATDEDGTFSAASLGLTVTPPNTVPTRALDTVASGDEGTSITLNGSFSDPDANTWTATVDYGDGSAIDAVTLNGDKTFTIAHTYADDGNYTVVVSLDDAAGGTDTANASVTVSNVAPTLVVSGPLTVEQHALFTLTFSSSDPGGDTISLWTVDWGDGTADNYSGGVTAAAHTFNQGNLTRTVSVTATDEDGTYSAASLTVDVTPSTTLIVDSLMDTVDASDGKYTLREAITDANATAGANRIVFDPALDLSVATDITLVGGQLVVTDDLEIAGPGASFLTISGGNASGIFYSDTLTVDLTISGVTLTNGSSADFGGAICVKNIDSLTVTDTIITGNSAPTVGGYGGGVYALGVTAVEVTGTTFSNNSAGDGGGVFASAGITLNITDSTFSNNSATNGGGVHGADTAALNITDSTFSDNTVTASGGGVHATSNTILTVQDSTFSLNAALDGGAIALGSGSSLRLLGSTLNDNTAGSHGGGVYVAGDSLFVSNTTIARNTTPTTGGYGGGVYTANTTGVFEILHSTIAGNQAEYGGGIQHVSGDLTLHGTLVAGNTASTNGPDWRTAVAINSASSYNLVGDGTGTVGVTDGTNGNQVGTSALPIDPLFAVDASGDPLLADNGGPVHTVGLQAASPAINAAGTAYFNDSNELPITTDARGVERMFASAIDVGAYEAISDQPYIAIAYQIMGPAPNGVTGPGPVASGSTITFEETPFDLAQTLPFRISNVGTQTLILDLDQMTLPEGVWLTERPYEFIEPGSNAVLEFQWDSQSNLSGAITIPTNDPTHASFVMNLSGTVTAQPNPPTVTSYGLLLDSGVSDTDDITYNPMITIQVGGDFVRGATIVEFDHGYTNNATDGGADGHVIVRHSGESAAYDPRTFDTAWPAPTSGTESASLRYRLIHVTEYGRTLSTGAWTDFDFTLEPTPTSSALTVSNLATQQGSIGDWTTPGAVAVTGQVDGSGTRYVQVAVNGQTLPDAIGDVDAQNNFTVELPFGLSYLNTSTVDVRAYEYSDSDEMNLYGAWASLTVQPASPASVASLSYDDNRLDEDGNPLAPALVGNLTSAVDSRFAEVEFYYNDGSQDVVVGRTWTDLYGSFTCVPSGLPVDVAVTVVARMVVRSEGSDPIFGASQSVSATYSPSDLIYVNGVSLTDPDVEGGTTTDNPQLKAVTNVEIGSDVVFEFSWSVDGGSYSTPVVLAGQAVYDPDATEEATHEDVDVYFRIPSLWEGLNDTQQLSVQVRGGGWDLMAGTYVYGTASTFAFTYNKPVDAIPTIGPLSLDGVDPGVTTTDNPVIAGTVSNDGDAGGLRVELYDGATLVGTATTDSEGDFLVYPTNLTAGGLTLSAKAREWNALTDAYQYSGASDITFTYDPPVVTAPQIATFGLADDTATPGDSVTSHALLTGSLTDDGDDLGRVLIEIDYDANDGVETIDATTFTDSSGVFYSLPTLASGAHTVAARAVRSDLVSGQDAFSAWSTLAFTLNTPGASWVPALSTISAINGQPDGQGTDVSPDTAVAGLVSSPGGFGDIVVAFDLGANGITDEQLSADGAGRFAWRPDVVSDPSGDTTVTINVRVGRTDQNPTEWSAWSNYSFIYHDDALASPESTIDSWSVGANADYYGYMEPYVPADGDTFINLSTHLAQGTITLSAAASSAYVEIDYRGDGAADGYAIPDSDGAFEFYASPDKYAVRARIVDVLPDGTSSYPNGGAWASFTVTDDPYGEIDGPAADIEVVVPESGVTEGGVQINADMTGKWVTISFEGGTLVGNLLPDVNGFISISAIETAVSDTLVDPMNSTTTIMESLPPGMNIGEVSLSDGVDILGTVSLPILNTADLDAAETTAAEAMRDEYFAAYQAFQTALDQLAASGARSQAGSNVQFPATTITTTTEGSSTNDPGVAQADVDRILNTPVPTVPLPDLGGGVPALDNDPEYQSAINGVVNTYNGSVSSAKNALNSGFDAAISAYNSRVEAAWSAYSAKYEALLEKYNKLDTADFYTSQKYRKLCDDHQDALAKIEQDYTDAKNDAQATYSTEVSDLGAQRDADLAQAAIDFPDPATRAREDAQAAIWHQYSKDVTEADRPHKKELILAAKDHQTSLADEYRDFQKAVPQAMADFEFERLNGDATGKDGTADLLEKMAQAGKKYETELAAAARDITKGASGATGTAELVQTYRNAIADAWAIAVAGVYAETLSALATWQAAPDTNADWATFVVELVTHAQTEANNLAIANTEATAKEATAERDAAEKVADANYAWHAGMLSLQYGTELKLMARDAKFRADAIKADQKCRNTIADEVHATAVKNIGDWKTHNDSATDAFIDNQITISNINYAYAQGYTADSRAYADGAMTYEEYTQSTSDRDQQANLDIGRENGSHDLAWVASEEGYRNGLASESKRLMDAISAAYADRETDLIAAAEIYWDDSILIGVAAETGVLTRDVVFVGGYNSAVGSFSTAIVAAADGYESEALSHAQTRANTDEISESTLVTGYIEDFFDAVSTAYASVTGAFGAYLTADATDAEDFYNTAEVNTTGLVGSLISKTVGAISSTLNAFYGKVSKDVAAMSRFAKSLLTDTQTNEREAIGVSQSLAEREVDARVVYLEAIRDAEKAARDRSAERNSARLNFRIDYGAAATSDSIEQWLDALENDPYGGGYPTYGADFVETDSASIPLPLNGYGGYYIDSLFGDTEGEYYYFYYSGDEYGYGIDPVDSIYYGPGDSSYEFDGYYFGQENDHGWVFDTFYDLPQLQQWASEDQTKADKQQAAAGYIKTNNSIYDGAAEGSEGFVKKYLSSETTGITTFSGDTWTAAGTANTTLDDSARTNDPTSDVLDYVETSATNDIGLSTDMSGNFGQYQIGWRTEEGDPLGDLAWATAVVSARDAYVGGAATNATTYINTVFTSLLTYSDSMRDAGLDLGGSLFDADRTFSTDSLAQEVAWIHEQFDAASKQRLAYLDAAIAESDGMADAQADEAQGLADASQAVADSAEAAVNESMEITDFMHRTDLDGNRTGNVNLTGMNGENVVVHPDDSVTSDGVQVGADLDALEGLTWMSLDSWQAATQGAFDAVRTQRDNEAATGRPTRQADSTTRLDDRATELAAARDAAEDVADTAYETESSAADNKYAVAALETATTYVAAYTTAVDTWTTTTQAAYVAYFAEASAAGTVFDAEACRLAGLYLDAVAQISQGDTIDSATFFLPGAESVDAEICFPAGTPVLMADGATRPIERIAVGELVWAAPSDAPDGQPTACRVTATYQNDPAETLQLTFTTTSGDTLTVSATPGHPFHVAGHGFIAATDLTVGDQCTARDGSPLTLAAVERIAEPRPVFNIQVESAHTYYVGHSAAVSLLVHNTCVDPSPLAVGLFQSEYGTPHTFTGGSNFSAPSNSTAEVVDSVEEEDGRTVTFTDANGGVTTSVYDAAGNMLSLTDPVGNTTTWTYDDSDNMTSETNALGFTSYYEYDASGNLTQYTDRRGVTIAYEYDLLGSVTLETWPGRTIEYHHDRYGRLTFVDDADVDYTYEYDDHGRLRVETVTTDDGQTFFLYNYDGRNRVESVTAVIDGVEDFTNTYLYNAAGLVREITQTGDNVTPKRVTFAYNPIDAIVTIRRYEGDALVVESVYEYERMSSGSGLASIGLSGVQHVDAQGAVLASHRYTYDDAGLVDTYTNDDGLAEYSYDATGQLVDADYDYRDDESFNYDANGNRLEYILGVNNQVLSDGLYWYTYDEEGARTEKYQWDDLDADGEVDDDERFDLTTYTWDARGRLTKITTKPDGQITTRVVQYAYDYLNRRVEKKIDDGVNPKTAERYTYLGHDIVLQTNKQGDLTHRYLHGPAVKLSPAAGPTEGNPPPAKRRCFPRKKGNRREFASPGPENKLE